jgi:hypothetical protein
MLVASRSARTVFALLLCAGWAVAVPVTYTLGTVAFSDGGTVSGSFTFDDETNTYSNVSITTTNGLVRSGATYTVVCSSPACIPSNHFQAFFVTANAADLTGTPGLAMIFSPGLSDAGGTISVGFVEEGTCSDPTCSTGPNQAQRVVFGATAVGVPPRNYFIQVRYLTLQYGDGVINFTNGGTIAGTDPAGTICVNVYAFDPAEEMISCCACKVTPNGLASISARTDIMGNTLTPGTPQSITVKLLATAANGGTCNAGSQPTSTNLAPGMKAWATTLHSLAVQGSPAPPPLTGLSETPFALSGLSTTEFNKLTSYCNFIQVTGSGFGQCKSCTSRVGAQGGTQY